MPSTQRRHVLAKPEINHAHTATPVPASVPIPAPQDAARLISMMESSVVAAYLRNLNTAVVSAAVAMYAEGRRLRLGAFPRFKS